MPDLLAYRVESLEKGAERREAKLQELTESAIRSDEQLGAILKSTGAISKELATLAREMREKPNRDFNSERTPLPGVVTETAPASQAGQSFAKSLNDLPNQVWMLIALGILTVGGVVTHEVAGAVLDRITSPAPAQIEAAP